MKKSALLISLYLISVYLISLVLQEAYIHVLIGLIAIHLLISLVPTDEKKESLIEETQNTEPDKPRLKNQVLLAIFLVGLVALNYLLPVLALFGAM